MPIEIVTAISALAVDGEPLALDERAELLGEDRALLDAGLGQDEHELLAAVAADQVATRAGCAEMRLGDAAQHDVADAVAVRVVDGLEVVDVDEGDRQRALVARRALDLGEERAEQGLAVGDAGQAVDRRAVMGVGEGDARCR